MNERGLQEMVQFVIAKIEALMQAARDDYSVDPVVFLVIYLVSAPVFYYSLFRMIRALAKRLGKQVMLWSAIFLCANVAPLLYVLVFGRNLPWWCTASSPCSSGRAFSPWSGSCGESRQHRLVHGSIPTPSFPCTTSVDESVRSTWRETDLKLALFTYAKSPCI